MGAETGSRDDRFKRALAEKFDCKESFRLRHSRGWLYADTHTRLGGSYASQCDDSFTRGSIISEEEYRIGLDIRQTDEVLHVWVNVFRAFGVDGSLSRCYRCMWW